MSKVDIRKCSISDLESAPNIDAVLDEYATETALFGLPSAKAQVDVYKQLELLGSLVVFGAYLDEAIIGFINVMLVMNPHYGIKIATSESFFVCKDYRDSGAGLELLSVAEEYAKQNGSPGIFISSIHGSALAAVLPRRGYIPSNEVFFKAFGHV